MTTSAEAESEHVPFGDLPPSAKLVAKVLEYEGKMTQSQLADETQMPQRTIRYALTRLEDNGYLTSRISFQDARKKVYDLTRDDDV